MNKILIALVLVVFVIFKTDFFKTQREMCLEAVEKGELVDNKKAKGWFGNYKTYAYKGKLYQYNSYHQCIKTTKPERFNVAIQRSDEEYLNYILGIREKGIDWDQKDSKENLDE